MGDSAAVDGLEATLSQVMVKSTPGTLQTSLPEVRQVTFHPASRSQRLFFRKFKRVVLLVVVLAFGFTLRALWYAYHHGNAVAAHETALAHYNKQAYPEAESHWQKALLGFRKTGYLESELQTYIWLARNASAMEKHEAAIAFLDAARERQMSVELRDEIFAAYHTYGQAKLKEGAEFFEAEAWQSAHEAASQAQLYLRKGPENSALVAKALRMSGRSQLKLGQRVSGMRALQESLTFQEDAAVKKLLAKLEATKPAPKPVVRKPVVEPSVRRPRPLRPRVRRVTKVRTQPKLPYPTYRPPDDEEEEDEDSGSSSRRSKRKKRSR